MAIITEGDPEEPSIPCGTYEPEGYDDEWNEVWEAFDHGVFPGHLPHAGVHVGHTLPAPGMSRYHLERLGDRLEGLEVLLVGIGGLFVGAIIGSIAAMIWWRLSVIGAAVLVASQAFGLGLLITLGRKLGVIYRSVLHALAP